MLALLALIGLTARGRAGDGGLRLLYGAVLASGLVLIPGPTLPRFPFYEALHRWLPFFGMIRNPRSSSSSSPWAALVLAALGARAVLSRLAAGARDANAVCWSLALSRASSSSRPPWHGVAVARFGDSPVYEALRRSATRVLYLPIWPGDSAYSSLYLYAITRTRVPAVNGYSPFVPRQYSSDVFESLEPLNVGDLDPAEASALRRLGVSHVVVDRAVFPPQVSAVPVGLHDRGPPRFARAGARARADPLWLFRVTGQGAIRAPGPTSPVGCSTKPSGRATRRGRWSTRPRPPAAASWPPGPGWTRRGFSRSAPTARFPPASTRRGSACAARASASTSPTDRGRRIIAERTVDVGPEWTTIVLPFVVERGQPLEFRAAWDGRQPAAIDWVLVVAADRPDPEWTYEVEALPHKLGERPDPQASGGWAGTPIPAKASGLRWSAGPFASFLRAATAWPSGCASRRLAWARSCASR